MRASLTREQIEFAKARTLQCDICKKLFTQKSNLRRHIKQQHSPKHKIATISCQRCGTQVKETSLNAHMQTQKCLRAVVQSTFHMPLSSTSMKPPTVDSLASMAAAADMAAAIHQQHVPLSGCSRSPSPVSPAYVPIRPTAAMASSFLSSDIHSATAVAAMLTSANHTTSVTSAAPPASFSSASTASMDMTMNTPSGSHSRSSGSPSLPHFMALSTMPMMSHSSSRSPSLPHFLPVSSMPVLSRESVASLASVTSAATRKSDRKRSRSCSQNSCSSDASIASSRSMTDYEGDVDVDTDVDADEEEREAMSQPPRQKRRKNVRSASEDTVRPNPPKVHFVPWHVPVLVVVSQDQFNQTVSSSSSFSSSSSSSSSLVQSQTTPPSHTTISEANIQDHIRAATALANSKFGACANNVIGRSMSNTVGRRTRDSVLTARQSESVKSEFSRDGDRAISGEGSTSPSLGQLVSSPKFAVPSSADKQNALNGKATSVLVAQQQTARGVRTRPVESDAQGHVLSPDRPEDLAAIRPPPRSCGDQRQTRHETGSTSTLAASSNAATSTRTRDAQSLLNLWHSAVAAQSRAQTSCSSLDSVSLGQVTASSSADMAPLVVRTNRPADVFARIEEVTQLFARDNESRSATLLDGVTRAQQTTWGSRGRSRAISTNV